LVVCLVAISATAAFAYDSHTPAQNWSIYAGLATSSIPPVDFGAMDTRIDAGVPLQSLIPALPPIGVRLVWEQRATLFRLNTIPSYETVLLAVGWEAWSQGAFGVTPTAAAVLLIDHVGGASGLAGEVGVVAGWEPLAALRIYAPLAIRVFADGLGVSFRLGVRPYLVVLPIGLDISYGLESAIPFSGAPASLRGTLQVMIGVGS
jgi:hypothetical protein